MPTFTVKERSKRTKVVVCKSTVTGVIDSAVEKLHLVPGEYKLSLDNGAFVDEDDVLADLPPLTELTLVQNDDLASEENLFDVTPNISVNCSIEQSASPFRLSNARAMSFPWRVLQDFVEDLKSGHIEVHQRKCIIHNLASFMMGKHDFSRATCSSLTNDLFAEYPKPFEIRDADGDVLSDGKASFFNSLYERVNFTKPNGKKQKRKRKEMESEDADDDLNPKWPHTCSEKLDSYGCAAWQPRLPKNVSEADLERVRIQLLDATDETEVLQLLEKSYWLQRHQINYRKGSIHDVLSNWPVLETPNPFQAHSSLLLGKDVRKIWAGSLTRFLVLYNYLSDFCMSAVISTKNEPYLSKLKEVREKAEEASDEMDTKTPLLVAAFIMLVHYFKDDLKCLVKLIDIGSSLEDVQSLCEVDRPLLLVRGQSFFDPNVTCFVVCEGELLVSTDNFLEGIKLFFLSFYNFNFHYPEKGRRFLEYIQRGIFKINPVEGQARKAPGEKRRVAFDPLVKKTILNVGKFHERMRNMTWISVMDEF